MDETMQMELFQIYDRPAIYRRDDRSETCLAWNREEGRFGEDVEALHTVLGGSTEVRRIDRDQARRLIARLLSGRANASDPEKAALQEFVTIEARGARERVPLTAAEEARCEAIIEAIVGARLQNGSLGLNEDETRLIA
jgi:hypothetical protein